MAAGTKIHSVRQPRFDRVRRAIDVEPDPDSYFDPFNLLADEFESARNTFTEALRRFESTPGCRYELLPARMDAEVLRFCDEVRAADNVITDCCKHYCQLWPDQFGGFTSPLLRRRVAAATAQLKALIPELLAHTARLNAFLESLPSHLAN